MQNLENNVQVSIYSHKSLCRVKLFWGQADFLWEKSSYKLKIILFWVKSTFTVKFSKFKKLDIKKGNVRNLPKLPPSKVNSTQWPMFRSAREYMLICAFFLNSAYYSAYINQ